MLQAVAVELDELADHAVLAQHLRDGEHQVGRGRAFRQLAGELEADDLRDQHRRRLAEHRGFGFDAADAPAEHAEAVDHRGVRVGAEHGVRERRSSIAVALTSRSIDHARQVLEVHLVHDAGVRRHDPEVVERLLAPAQEAVALPVALELDLAVEFQRIGAAEHVDLHRVVDHQFGRDQRVDLRGVAAQACTTASRIAARSTTHGTPVKSCSTTRAGMKAISVSGSSFASHVGDRFDVSLRDRDAVFVAQQVLEQDLHRVRQLGQVEALPEAWPGCR